jgi:hypothetical protein
VVKPPRVIGVGGGEEGRGVGNAENKKEMLKRKKRKKKDKSGSVFTLAESAATSSLKGQERYTCLG